MTEAGRQDLETIKALESNTKSCDDASFYEHAEHAIAGPAVSWSNRDGAAPLTVHVYTRVRQRTPYASFMCARADCPSRGEPTAVLGDDGFIVDKCVFCEEPRGAVLRGRGR